MAANQQLKDYIVQQKKLGVSKDVIKSALLGAGWKDTDVNDAFSETETATPAMQQPAIQPAAQPAMQASPISKPAAPMEPAAKLSPFSFTGGSTSDIFQPKSVPDFKPAGMDIKPGISGIKMEAKPDVKPSGISETKPQFVSVDQKSKPASGGKILPISLGILSLILLGGNVYFFLHGGSASQIDAVKSANASLQTQVDSLTSDKKSLSDQVDSLNKTVTDLTNQVSIFAVPQSGPTSSVPFDVSGALGGGGKLLYTITTSKNVVLYVKNSKDTLVDSALKSLVGNQVEIGGTHQAESNYLTVATVNGQSLEAAAQATSTAPAASTSTPAAQQPAAPAVTSTATSTP